MDNQMGKRPHISSDMISNLPDSIVEKILMCLPIKDAVRTSVLSSNWRYKWSTIPELEFIEKDFEHKTDKFVTFIDRFLQIHRGPIQKFILVTTSLQNSSAIDSWFHFLLRTSVKRLALINSKNMRYKIPSFLFSFQELRNLCLANCIFESPPKINGFTNLKVLYLRNITIANQEIFENMISSCPVLKWLSLVQLSSLSCLKVRALKLQFFKIEGYFDNISSLDAPNLTEVCIKLTSIIQSGETLGGRGMFLFSLANIKKLTIYGCFLQFLTMARTSGCSELPISYNYLKTLSLQVNFKDQNAISVTIWLLKKSPNLQKLEIYARSDTKTAINLVKDLWEAHGKLDSSMSHLKMIKIHDISGIQSEMAFIKHLLADSPMLEVLSLTARLFANIKETTVLKELLKFQRASTSAEIQYTSAV